MSTLLKFSLEKGSKKHTCPGCNKPKKYNRYVNLETNEYLPIEYGFCERIISCGYKNHDIKGYLREQLGEQVKKKPSLSQIPNDLVLKSLNPAMWEKNNFILYLISLFGETVAAEAIKRFQIGTGSKNKGSTIFWQIDQGNRVRTGKIITYNPKTGKRNKNAYPPVGWVHAELVNKGILNSFNLNQCLFGEHQLCHKNTEKAIGIVESEKSAVILSIILPDITWLAVGGIHNLNPKLCSPLLNRQIILYPDSDGYNQWKAKAAILSENGFNILVDDSTEEAATSNEKARGLDLVDYLVNTIPT